jgi:hypothetical protein
MDFDANERSCEVPGHKVRVISKPIAVSIELNVSRFYSGTAAHVTGFRAKDVGTVLPAIGPPDPVATGNIHE